MRTLSRRERRVRGVILSLALLAAAAGLVFAKPDAPTAKASARPASQRNAQVRAGAAPALSPAAVAAARDFLAGYLSYLYGRAPASTIKDTTPGFARALELHPPRVPPGLAALTPRVVRVLPTAAPDGLIGASALVTDQETLTYRIPLLLTTTPNGRVLVTGLDTP